MLHDCPFCNHQKARLHRSNEETGSASCRDIYECGECSLLYPHPRFSQNEIFEHLARLHTNKSGFEYAGGSFSAKRDAGRWNFLKKFVPAGNRLALDIGAFDGSFCRILEALGFDACGLEPQENASSFARGKGLKVFSGSFPDRIPAELRSKRYALISVMEAIYYFVDLRESLGRIYEMLGDRGLLLIKCHQGNSMYYEGHSYFSRYGDFVQGIPTRRALTYCLDATGFEVIKTRGVTDWDLLPEYLKAARFELLKKIVLKFYNSFMLNYSREAIDRADRLIFLALKRT